MSPGKPVRGTLGAGNLRPDLVMLDDIEDKDDVQNPDLRMKLMEWLMKDVLPLGSNAVFDLRGTLLHYASLLANALTFPGWDAAKYAAVTDDGQSLWPERHSIEYLMAKRATFESQGALYAWQSEYMNNPVQSENAMFPAKLWRVYPDSYQRPPERRDFDVLVAGVDSANSSKTTADYSVIAVWGIMPDGTYHLHELIRGRWDWHTLLTTCITLHDRIRPDMWAVEKAASGQQLIQEFERLRIPVDPIQAITDLFTRAQPMQPLLHQRLLYRRAEHLWLAEEMESFPYAAHDDGVAACIAAFKRLLFTRRGRVLTL
jgi:predicted phage terminase large subunit-like protein